MYVPLGGIGISVAALGLDLSQADSFSIHQQNLLEDFCNQISLALERHRLNQISEKARLLVESERLSKTLLDSMSHEMRTPLAAIRSATGTLVDLSRTAALGLQNDMLAEIEQATERLDRLVGNVLEASRIESGAVRPRLNECDVKDLIHVSISETESQLARHPLVLHISPDLPLVRLDFVLMQQVITNLLSNAAFHTPPGSTIELTAQVEQGQLVLIISDSGPGISPSSLPRVFDKFYRAPNAPAGGTGLGLSLVKGFVEAHGGVVKVENRPGSGAAFTIRLPLAVPP
jgi:two-component system sensor histidine kinase KdpD